ncbi:MAG: hypothetical protein RSC06_04220, partial [Clostridia bacterium]
MKRYDIICPICLAPLKPEDIHFESINPDNKMTKNDNRAEHMKRYASSFGENDRRLFTREILKPSEVSVTGEYPAVYTEINDKTKLKMPNTRRVCGHCNFPLPADAGKMPMVMIGMAGNTDVGKTVYMLSVIQNLSNLFASDETSAMSKISIDLVDADQHPLTKADSGQISVKDRMFSGLSGEALKRYLEDNLPGYHFDNLRPDLRAFLLPPNTGGQFQWPAIFKLTINEHNCLLVLYDIAGEAFKPGHEAMAAAIGRHFSAADGIIYLLDEQNTGDGHMAATMIALIKQNSEQRTKPCYIAFTASKADKCYNDKNKDDKNKALLDQVLMPDKPNPHRSGLLWRHVLMMDSVFRPVLSPYTDTIQSELEAYFHDPFNKDPSYIQNVNSAFQRLDRQPEEYRFTRYFAVSSLGKGAMNNYLELPKDMSEIRKESSLKDTPTPAAFSGSNGGSLNPSIDMLDPFDKTYVEPEGRRQDAVGAQAQNESEIRTGILTKSAEGINGSEDHVLYGQNDVDSNKRVDGNPCDQTDGALHAQADHPDGNQTNGDPYAQADHPDGNQTDGDPYAQADHPDGN